jgi:penicillin-binding protein 1B
MGFTAPAAGKTGSSRDGWFAGYTPNFVCVVWVGFDNNSDLGLTGGVTAAPIWAEFMKNALALHPELGGEFEDPGDILTVDIDPATGKVASPDAANVRHELFIRGTEPTATENGQPETEPATVPPPESPTSPAVTPTPKPGTTQPGIARNTIAPGATASGTISLVVCPLTGLLPMSGVCPSGVTRVFPAGREPHFTCREAYHTNRPRVVSN